MGMKLSTALDIIEKHPNITSGAASSANLFTAWVSYTAMVMPLLQALSLTIGITLGIITLAGIIRGWINKRRG